MGMLDQIFGGSAGTQGLLAGSMALMNSGGPSRTPVTLGQGLAQGFGAGQKAYQGVQEFEMQKQLRDAQIAKMKADADARETDAEFAKQAMEVLNSGDPDALTKFATIGALRGKPGAVQLLKMAEDRKKELADDADWDAYKSKVTPATEAQPAVIVGKPGEDAMATDAANPIARPAVIGKPAGRSGGLFASYLNHPDPATSAAGLQAQGLLDSSNVPRQKWLDTMQGKLATMDQNYRNREDRQVDAAANDVRDRTTREEMIRLAAGLRPPTPEAPLVQIMQDGKPIWVSRASAINQEAVPTGGSARQTSVSERAVTSALNMATKPIEAQLNAINSYWDVRDQDTAQAVMVAADLLRQSSKAGNVRFKNEADKLLGSGYGAGSISDRMANFLSQEFKGRPSKATLKNLDKLMGALHGATLDNLAEQTKKYAGQAKGKGLDLKRAIGLPRIIGKTMITPDGTRYDYPTEEKAIAEAEQWEKENQ